MVADIRFPDTRNTLTVVPEYRPLIHNKTFPDTLLIQADIEPKAWYSQT